MPNHEDKAQSSHSAEKDPVLHLKEKPKKSILKRAKVPAPKADPRAHFDEMNILATYHPADKDYGHMKIEEPKTPYHFSDNEMNTSDEEKAVNSTTLLEAFSAKPAAEQMETSSCEDEPLTEEAKRRKQQFGLKRKMHYNEGAALKAHLEHLQDEDDDE